jgi:hypothetical protein
MVAAAAWATVAAAWAVVAAASRRWTGKQLAGT